MSAKTIVESTSDTRCLRSCSSVCTWRETLRPFFLSYISYFMNDSSVIHRESRDDDTNEIQIDQRNENMAYHRLQEIGWNRSGGQFSRSINSELLRHEKEKERSWIQVAVLSFEQTPVHIGITEKIMMRMIRSVSRLYQMLIVAQLKRKRKDYLCVWNAHRHERREK